MATIPVPLNEARTTGVDDVGSWQTVTTTASDTYTVPNRPGVALSINAAPETSAEVTFVTVAKVDGFDVADHTVTIEPSALFGRFPPEVFGATIQFTTSVPCSVQAYV